MGKTILAVGNSTMDVLLNVPYAPTGGRSVSSKDRYAFTPGGNGAYTAVAVARSGGNCALCTRIGDDECGSKLVSEFEYENVDVSYIIKDKSSQTGLKVYLLEEYGNGGRIVYRGANAKLSPLDVERAFGCEPALVTADLSMDENVLKKLAEKSADAGIPFVLDATGAYENYRSGGLDGVDVIICDEKEVETLAGIKPNSTENYLRASLALASKFPVQFTVLKLGNKGAYIYDGTYCELLSSVGLQTVDTTASNQVFVGAFCANFVINYDVYEATKYALAASSFSASKVGGFSSIPTNAQVCDLLD